MSEEANKEPKAENTDTATEAKTVENKNETPSTEASSEEQTTSKTDNTKEDVKAEAPQEEPAKEADNKPTGWLGADAKIENGNLVPLKEMPVFKAGDTITVYYKIIEGNKQRIQAFKGDVIQTKGTGVTKTFTIRKISNGIGVERIIPLLSPAIDKIEVNKRGKVRRSKIFYLRGLKGKKAKIKEKRS